MRALSSSHRKQLEASVLAARRAAESASRASIEALGVFLDRRPDHLDANQAALRNGLRAKWRQLGGDRELLIAESAYEQWHRLLFARFLAENDLLLHPSFKGAVTLADCEELAAELGEPDGWSVAARFASEILPGIFRLDDPCVCLRLAPEGRHALEQILDGLPAEVFTADDALGWVYQFWQKDKKDEINRSERKIGGADLGPVTQLFTENYMVRFLLENSLGAWWAARHPDSPLVKGFDYLRLGDDGRPAAGTFDGWPDRVAEVTMMDPCCGSGHFLGEAFSMLWQMRAEEEGLSPVEAQDAVLRDNLFGLELDPRCVQIATFAVALQAWKAGGGWRHLPVPNIACSGVPIRAPVEEWKALARGDKRIEDALVRLHLLFREADSHGSLVDPERATVRGYEPQQSFDDVNWVDVAPLLDAVVSREVLADPGSSVLGATASVTARVASYLARKYVIVATNPPFLGKSKHDDRVARFLDLYFPEGAQDLATTFAQRAQQLCMPGGAGALVLPQNWLTQSSYRSLRLRFLGEQRLAVAALLGEEGFESFGVRGPRTMLAVFEDTPPKLGAVTAVLDVSAPPGKQQVLIPEKIHRLLNDPLLFVRQANHSSTPAQRISLVQHSELPRLGEFARSFQGLKTGDNARFTRSFWELPCLDDDWTRLQGSVAETHPWKGREEILYWQTGIGVLGSSSQARVQGQAAWTRRGVLVREMRDLSATLYAGDVFQSNGIAIIPRRELDLPALWNFVSSTEYSAAVRALDSKLGIATASAVDVPFDIDRWRKVAEAAGPLPEPWSDDPTQWLFEGRPEVSTAPLPVAVARLAGYRWPEQAESDDLDAFADRDGIVCLPSVAGEAPAAERVQQVLAAAFADAWSPGKVNGLLEQVGSKNRNLGDWFRDEFFKQHCALFAGRPFLWHIWDGQRDGFSALVNYHRLDRKTLEKLTYTYLGQDWVERQRAEVRDEVAGAEARLEAAHKLQRKLEMILEGEKPYDIYVRWKGPHEQPVGWEPDLNDGVRLNIRPFVEAGVLRAPFNVHWRKDRGKNSDGSERHNDIHLSLAEKLEARKLAGRA